jgi:hypothetical protein
MRAALATAVAAAAAAAGCAGHSPSHPAHSASRHVSTAEYRLELQQILSRIGSILLKQTMAISRAPEPRLASIHITRLSQQLRAAASELARLQTPANARGAHALLINGLRELAGELTTLNKPKRNSVRPLASFPAQITQTHGLRAIGRAVTSLRRHGYLPAKP